MENRTSQKRYYKETTGKLNSGNGVGWSWSIRNDSFPLYGQPIIRYYSDYYVYLTYKDYNAYAYHYFYSLTDGQVLRKLDNDVKDSVLGGNGNFNNSSAFGNDTTDGIYFGHFLYKNIESDRIRFIGLKGFMNNRGPEENVNYFNPDSGGSNFTYTTKSRQRVEGTNMGGGTCTEVFSCSDYQYQIINISLKYMFDMQTIYFQKS